MANESDFYAKWDGQKITPATKDYKIEILNLLEKVISLLEDIKNK